MIEQKSIKWNIIKFDRKTKNKTIEEILNSRFEWDEFLPNTLDSLHDPYLFEDMQKAVERIKQAKDNDEKVFIFWDYDVDGVTSTSILMHFFTKIWLKASYRLPHRVKDWYWLKQYFVDEAKELWVSLIITVDCWTRDVEIIKYAKSIWVDIIVTDHHAVPEIIPEEAIAIINPKRQDCTYPYKNLAWAWVAFKLMQALAKEYLNYDEYRQYLIESIDICAIGTVADCMILTWENRVIVELWLAQIKNSRSRWIRRLLEEDLDTDLDADVFGFTIWPRLNAAGRMDTPYKAVNLILNNSDSVEKTLREIEQLNEKRKFLTKQFVEEAESKINKQDNLLFYISKDVPHGIMWIVAGRITEKYHKPCIALKDEGDKYVASCRAPEYFSMIEILEKRRDMFLAFGWHKQAAGFSISKDKLVEFKSSILSEVNKLDLSQEIKEIEITKIVDLNELWFSFLRKVNKFKPFWMWNPKPVFMVENLNDFKVEILWNKSRDHLKFTTKHLFKMFAFYMWDYYEEIKIWVRDWKKLDLIFDISEDNWMGKKNLMLKVLDVVLK